MTAHHDLFVQQFLPQKTEMPDLINLETFGYPEILNCAEPLLDDAIKEGNGIKIAVIMDEGEWSYADLQKDSNQIARVLVEDLNMIPGNRVLLRAPNSYSMLAAWFGVIKAGGVAVSTMPLLRSVELQTIINKARVSIAFCDSRLMEELKKIKSGSCLEQLVSFRDGELDERKKGKPVDFENLATFKEDPCLIAFTSGTTGKPKAAVHSHQDMLTM